LGNLPANTKGYVIMLKYQQREDRYKYYKFINSSDGEELEAYFKQDVWNIWIMNNKVSKSGDSELNMSGNLVKGLPTGHPPMCEEMKLLVGNNRPS
jgi:hypothetical protein